MIKLLNSIPLIAFFGVFFLADKNFLAATMGLLIGTLFQLACYFLFSLKLTKATLYSALAIIFFSALSLAFNDSLFIKIKSSMVFGLLSLFFMYEATLNKTSIIKKFLGDPANTDSLPLNLKVFSWISCIGFAGISITNLILINTISDENWVLFKLMGLPSLTFLVVILAVASSYFWNKNQTSKPTDIVPE